MKRRGQTRCSPWGWVVVPRGNFEKLDKTEKQYHVYTMSTNPYIFCKNAGGKKDAQSTQGRK